MADRFAAAAMMAGHPNDASPLSLRNLPFAIQMGADDGAYDRNKVAAEWGQKLDDLQADDKDGYEHKVDLYEGKGHWMDREDAAAVEWMAQFKRDLRPSKIVWKQDDVTHDRFYWLAVEEPKAGSLVTATRDGQTITIESGDAGRVTVRLDDEMVNLDEPVKIIANGEVVFEDKVARTAQTLLKTLHERGDPRGIFPAEVTVDVPEKQ